MNEKRTGYSISIVIPAYNEESNIEDVVLESLEVLRKLTDRYEVLVMNDASGDRTGAILDSLAEKFGPAVRVIHHRSNMGTNLSLVELFRHARHELVFFLPADKQIQPDALHRYLPLIEEGSADIVLGWREKRADPAYRLFFNWAYRMLLRFFLDISFKDAAASDLYKKSVLDKIQMESRGRLLQAEIAAKAACLGYRVREVSVEHYPRVAGHQTGVNPKTAWLSFTDLVRVGFKIRALKKKFRRLQALPDKRPSGGFRSYAQEKV